MRERIFVDRTGRMKVLGPTGELWFDVEDISLLSDKELGVIGRIKPSAEDKPAIIDYSNINEWRKKFRKISEQLKQDRDGE